MVPVRINLQKDRQLQVQWPDGTTSTWSIESLRAMCPCAQCRELRQQQTQKKSLLTVLPGNYSNPITVTDAQLVGNYAIKLVFSDGHDTGIYSFDYLRQAGAVTR